MTRIKTTASPFPVNPEFGAKIKEARLVKQIPVVTLADILGIPVGMLMRIENGKEHLGSARVLVQLSEILDIPKEDLIILATKRTYDELYAHFKEIEEKEPEEEEEDFYVGPIDGFGKFVESAFAGLSDDELFERMAALFDMTESELWTEVAQELLHHEITGNWTFEDDWPDDDDDDDFWADFDDDDDEEDDDGDDDLEEVEPEK